MDDDTGGSSETCTQTTEKKQRQRKLKVRQTRRRSQIHADLLKSASADAMQENWQSLPAREHDTLNPARNSSRCSNSQKTQWWNCRMPRWTRECANCSLDCTWEASSAAVESKSWRDSSTLSQPSAGLKLPRTLRALKALWRHTPGRRRKCSDVGMPGGHLLATRGTRSCTAGTVRAPGAIRIFTALNSAGNTTIRSGETFDRRLPLLDAATASPIKSQAKQNPAKVASWTLQPEWLGRSVSGNVE